MGRVRSAENAKDPATGRPLSVGVGYRGPGQYRGRKLIDGKSTTKTFETDKLARQWLEETAAKVRAGEFVDRSSLDKSTLAELVQRYVNEEMQDGGSRRGATEDRGHVPAITGDAIGVLKLSKLTPAAVRGFKKRQEELKYAPATIVKRLNLLAGIISHATTEWDMPFARNPASGKEVKRPAGADVKRDRRLLPPPPAEVRAALAAGEPPPKHEGDRLLEAIAKSEFADDAPVTKLALAQPTRQRCAHRASVEHRSNIRNRRFSGDVMGLWAALNRRWKGPDQGRLHRSRTVKQVGKRWAINYLSI